MHFKMDSKQLLIALGLLAVCLIVAIEANQQQQQQSQQNKTTTTKIDKQLVAKKKLQLQAKPTTQQQQQVPSSPAKVMRVARSIAAGDDLLSLASNNKKVRSSDALDPLMTAAHDKKYMLVKKKPKHKKIKMEVFKPKMKYKKIKMKIPVKKMKKKKVKGYLVKKEHHHHEH